MNALDKVTAKIKIKIKELEQDIMLAQMIQDIQDEFVSQMVKDVYTEVLDLINETIAEEAPKPKEDKHVEIPKGWSRAIYDPQENTLTFAIPKNQVNPQFLKYLLIANKIPSNVKCIYKED